MYNCYFQLQYVTEFSRFTKFQLPDLVGKFFTEYTAFAINYQGAEQHPRSRLSMENNYWDCVGTGLFEFECSECHAAYAISLLCTHTNTHTHKRNDWKADIIRVTCVRSPRRCESTGVQSSQFVCTALQISVVHGTCSCSL